MKVYLVVEVTSSWNDNFGILSAHATKTSAKKEVERLQREEAKRVGKCRKQGIEIDWSTEHQVIEKEVLD